MNLEALVKQKDDQIIAQEAEIARLYSEHERESRE